MANFNPTIITDSGLSLIAKISSGSGQMRFTRICTSKSSYSVDEAQHLTELTTIEQETTIDKVEIINDTAVKVSAVITNKLLESGYYINAIGLYAEDPDLGEILYSITIAKVPDWMQPDSGSGVSSLLIQLITQVSNSSIVKTELNPSVLATVQDLEDLKNSFPTTLPANGGNADTAKSVQSATGKALLFEDNEGGNLRLVSPDGNHSVEMDLYNNTEFRMYFTDNGELTFPASYDSSTKRFNINGDADSVDGLHGSDLACITDVIGGLRRGWASNNAGLIMAYGDREVVKTTNDLSYFGWTLDSDGWFIPIIVSQYSNGTNITMSNAPIGYDTTADQHRATFVYKNRTYYACWANPNSLGNPTVDGGLYLTVTNNDYVTACKTLIDMCESIDSDTVDGKHASEFALKTDIPTSLPANGGNAETAKSVRSPTGKASLFEDPEGGNLMLTSPDGTKTLEIDLYDNMRMRFILWKDGTPIMPLNYDFSTGKFNIVGDISNADTLDGKHASDFYQIASGLRTDAVYYDIFSTTLSNSHNCWNKWCHIVGNSSDTSTSDYINNAPESGYGALWYEVFTGGDPNRAFQIAIGCFGWQNNTFIRYQQDGNWSGWKNIADGGNAATANTAGTLAATASNICLRNMSSGTANATTTNCPSGAWYGQYEEV